MTIQIHHLAIYDDARNWLTAPDDGLDALLDPGHQNDILSAVRHIMRDEWHVDMIPEVHAFVVHPTNRWGHNAQIEVTYNKRGWRAVYGLHLGERVTNVQCYLD